MPYLIPYLPDDQKAADALRQWRWPAGGKCPRWGNAAVESRDRCANGLQRLHCVPGAARLGQLLALCTAWTRALCEERPWRPRAWWRVIGVGPWQLNAPDMATAADRQERTAQRWLHLLEGGLDETDPLEPPRHLEHHVAADACDQRAGSTGRSRAVARRDRAPRHRGLQRRGRATAATGRPPLLGLGQRRAKADQAAPAAPVSLAGLEHGRRATIQPIMAATGQTGAQGCTDADTLSHGTETA